jgi:hypothetical protein
VLGKTPTAANWTSRSGSGEKSDYIMHESLNRSMHFALKETDCDQLRRGIDRSKLIESTKSRDPGRRFEVPQGPNRPLDAIKASQSAWISSSISAGSDTVRPTSSRNNAVYRFRNRWMRVLTPPTVT